VLGAAPSQAPEVGVEAATDAACPAWAKLRMSAEKAAGCWVTNTIAGPRKQKQIIVGL